MRTALAIFAILLAIVLFACAGMSGLGGLMLANRDGGPTQETIWLYAALGFTFYAGVGVVFLCIGLTLLAKRRDVPAA